MPDFGVQFDDDSLVGLAREVPEAAQAGLRAAAREWHQNLLPEHFEPGAAGRYGYFKRKPRYAPREREAAASRNKKFRPPTTARGKIAYERNRRKAELRRGANAAQPRKRVQPQPLRKSGLLRSMSTARATFQTRGGSDVAALVRVPWYVWANRRRGELLAELVAMDPADDARLQEVAGEAVAKALAKKETNQ